MMISLYCGATAETDVTRTIFKKAMSMGLGISKEEIHFWQILIKEF